MEKDLLKALNLVLSLSDKLGTKSYVWGGLTLDIWEGKLLRDHYDIDVLTENFHSFQSQFSQGFREAGYATHQLENDDLRAEKNGIKIHFGHVVVQNNRAEWTHNGDKGSIFFPGEWLDQDPHKFIGMQVLTTEPEFEYVLKHHPELMNADWVPRPKDIAARQRLTDILQTQYDDLSVLRNSVESRNMPTAIIIHGAYGSPKEHWIPWMRAQLEQIGYAVHVPQFPTPEGQSLDNWLAVFADYEQHLDQSSILIAHSIGAAFTLNVLERLQKPIRAAYLVAGFVGPLGIELDTINKTIAERQFHWKTIKANCKHFTVISSDDDPYVPLVKGQELAEKLGVDMTLIRNAGHFNTRAGFTDFPQLLTLISKE